MKGSILKVQRKSGNVYAIRFYDQEGNRHYKTIGERKTDAVIALRQILSKVDTGEYKPLPDMKFKDFIEKWLAAKQPDVRPKTFYSYKQHCASQFIPYFNNRKLNSIKHDDIEAFKAHLFNEGKKPANIAKYLTTLKIAFNAACVWGYLQSNPAKFVKKPTFKKFEPMFLTPEQLKKLVDTTPDRHKAIMATACFTGMRQSELLGLKWDDVDLNNKKIYVRRSYQWGEFLDTKTAASRRGIDIPSFLVTLLKEHQLRQLVDIPENEYNLVFPNEIGKPMYARGIIRNIFEPVLRISGLPPIRFHDLRHSYASMLISQNANIKYVQKQLGHSTVQMTLNVYSHLLPDAGSEAIGKLEAIFSDKKAVVIE